MADEPMAHPTLGEVYRVLLDVRNDVKAQNGRVFDHESRLAVLEDRSPGRSGGLWGGAIGGTLAVVIEIMARIWTKP